MPVQVDLTASRCQVRGVAADTSLPISNSMPGYFPERHPAAGTLHHAVEKMFSQLLARTRPWMSQESWQRNVARTRKTITATIANEALGSNAWKVQECEGRGDAVEKRGDPEALGVQLRLTLVTLIHGVRKNKMSANALGSGHPRMHQVASPMNKFHIGGTSRHKLRPRIISTNSEDSNVWLSFSSNIPSLDSATVIMYILRSYGPTLWRRDSLLQLAVQASPSSKNRIFCLLEIVVDRKMPHVRNAGTKTFTFLWSIADLPVPRMPRDCGSEKSWI